LRREDGCVLIAFSPYYSHVIYLDSGRDVTKDYTDIKTILDKALNGFRAVVGPLKYEKRSKHGVYVNSHITNFPCLKQSSTDNGMEHWYAILQMRAYAKDEERLLLPSNIQERAKLERTGSSVRAEFRAIQREIATILKRDVITRGGLFNYSGIPLSNAQIEDRLAANGDMRTFTTLGGIHPFPPKPKPKKT
jgi:hypothetical protein